MDCRNAIYFKDIFDVKLFECIIYKFTAYFKAMLDARPPELASVNLPLVSLVLIVAICSIFAIVAFGLWIRPEKMSIRKMDLFGLLLCISFVGYYGSLAVIVTTWISKNKIIETLSLPIHIVSLFTMIISFIQVYIQRPSYQLTIPSDHSLGYPSSMILAFFHSLLQWLTVFFFFNVAPLGYVPNHLFAKSQMLMFWVMICNMGWGMMIEDYLTHRTSKDFLVVREKSRSPMFTFVLPAGPGKLDGKSKTIKQ